MKKILGILVCLMMLTTVALASPLMDYSSGKASIDLTLRNTENSGPQVNAVGTFVNGLSYPKKSNLDAAVTFGLGNNFAFEYRNFEPTSKNFSLYNVGGLPGVNVYQNLKLATNEFNVLYKVDKNVAAFAGYMTTKATWSASANSPLITFPHGPTLSDSQNLYQIGVVGSSVIAPKTTLWGSVAVGNHSLTNWEVGVGYEFATNLEFNVNYREIKANVQNNDFKTNGLGYGITLKF